MNQRGPHAALQALAGGGAGGAEVIELLRQILAATHDVCELQRAVLATMRPSNGTGQRSRGGVRATAGTAPLAISADLLACAWAIYDVRKWTCEELVDEVAIGASVDHARLRATLKDLGIANTKQLGTYLRHRVGAQAEGFALEREARKNRDKACVWSVVRV